MPELPEVEAIRLSLAPHIAELQLTAMEVYRPELIQCGQGLEPASLIGRWPAAFYRRGKYLLLLMRDYPAPLDADQSEIDDGWAAMLTAAQDSDLLLTMHFRMTGRLAIFEQMDAYTHLLFELTAEDGSLTKLAWHDVRRFGRLQLLTAGQGHQLQTGVASLGPEPFSPALDAAYLMAQSVRHRRLNLAAFLLNQTIVAGLGTIYVSESLFAAGLSPARLSSELNSTDWERWLAVIHPLLNEAITQRGTTFSDYRDGDNQPGGFQELLNIYGRKTCSVCGHALERVSSGGRQVAFCPHCQT